MARERLAAPESTSWLCTMRSTTAASHLGSKICCSLLSMPAATSTPSQVMESTTHPAGGCTLPPLKYHTTGVLATTKVPEFVFISVASELATLSKHPRSADQHPQHVLRRLSALCLAITRPSTAVPCPGFVNDVKRRLTLILA
ncbi:hypothetical protein NUW54_g11558 [Trametes sanguinea]|uniref:Uncharacterized protein n=1 Tax=Trametes sanguinea TaxID=158606 RepID=A0ACC1NBT0_9APHY|nr:hypothetical protein NUW54_g11558 [Trametes sanguinea]